MKLLILIFPLYFMLTSKSFAYLDPGTGSIILQAIIGFFAFASIWWKKIINKIKKLYRKKIKHKFDK